MDLFSPEWPEVSFRKNKRQKYIRIRVHPDRITVSAPHRCNKREMVRFLDEKREWIDETLEKMQAHKNELARIEKRNEGNILLRGNWVPVVYNMNGGSRWKMYEEDGNVVCLYPVDADPKLPTELVQKFYRKCAENDLRKRLAEISEGLPFKYERVFIRSQKTKWGTCSSKGNLSFNWRLIKCPVWIWDYLFIHELCHTVHMNHSKAYWKLVGEYFPRYKEARVWIRKNGSLIFRDP